MRREFGLEIYKRMLKNNNIWVITADLGMGLWDKVREDFTERFVNTGASEQTACNICIGLSYSGKIPIFYSITPFLIYRCFEQLRTYVSWEKIPIKLFGSGRDYDYEKDGWSHQCPDVKAILNTLPNIKQYYPKDTNEMLQLLPQVILSKDPIFMSLCR